jgi:hypothetical protein
VWIELLVGVMRCRRRLLLAGLDGRFEQVDSLEQVDPVRAG